MNWLTKKEVEAMTGLDYDKARRVMDRRGGELVLPNGTKIMMTRRGAAKWPHLIGYGGADIREVMDDPPGKLLSPPRGQLKTLEEMHVDSHARAVRRACRLEKVRLFLKQEGVEVPEMLSYSIESDAKKTNAPLGSCTPARNAHEALRLVDEPRTKEKLRRIIL